MKKLQIILLSLFFISNAYSINWTTSYEAAQKMALIENKLIVIDFWADWCGPCKKMDRDSWNTEEVSKIMENFIGLKIDIDTETLLSSRYGVRGIPNVYIIDPNGNVLVDSIGYMDKIDLSNFLKKHALNTSFLQKELIQYFRNENMGTSLRVARKYMDYSFFVDDKLKYDILSLSDTYLDNSEKMLKNQPEFEQKIMLLKLTNEIYKGNFSKAERKLSKIDINTIYDINLSEYYFLKYCFLRAESSDEAIIWLEKLKKAVGYDIYDFRIKKLFDQS